MAWTEQDYQEIVARLKTESQGVGDVPNAETLTGISSLPAYQEKDGEDIIVRAPLELLAAPALDAADKANAAATKAEENATAAQTAANSANEKAGLAAQAASDANAAKEGAEAATQSANNAASNAEEKATAANTAAQDAEKVANNPTYIGKDHYVYVYNKDTESFDKTDIYCKGEPGSSFRVAGEYDTLEALKSAVPDGSAVDGFMAVGTEAPYDYYAWVNGEWVSQGKIGGIDEAPTDGKAYGRKNGDWAEVPEHLNLTSENLNDINGAGFATQKSPTDYTSPENNYPINENGALIFANANYGHSNQIYGSCLTNRWFARGGGNQQGVRTNWKEFAFTDDVLTKTNTSSFTPTGDYQPATKKYVDDNVTLYFKINNDKFLSYLGTPAYYKDGDAETAITYVFNTIDNFKNFVNNALDYGYALVFINRTTNEKMYIRDYHVYRSSNGNYELSFIFIYSANDGSDIFYLITTRVFMSYNASNGYKFIVNNLVQSDNLTTLTKKTAAEYDAIGSKDANTAYCVTD